MRVSEEKKPKLTMSQDTHHLPVHEVLLFLETDASQGLPQNEAASRLERFGPNTLPRIRRHGSFMRFILQFHHPLIYILTASSGITALLGEWVDAGVIFGVVLVNAIVGFIQESRAENALDALIAMVKTEATVLRGGEKCKIPSSDLVPGDVVLLEAGDKVPADLRLTSVRELQIDESALTGESLVVSKSEHRLPTETLMADRQNMAYSSTLVTSGQGKGVVVSTGSATEIGRIHQLVGETPDIETPLTKKIAHFSKILTVVILGLAGVTFAIGIWRGQSAVEMFMAAVALAVGAIPEGLPAAVTITLAIGVSRMAKRHAIIRKLPAVETLGSTTVICSDKTGTLTENQMTVQRVWAGGQLFRVSGTGYNPMGEFTKDGQLVNWDHEPALSACLLAGVLCNDAQLVKQKENWDIVGDPTEGAMLVSACKGGLDVKQIQHEVTRENVLPFESENQFMATLDRRGADQQAVMSVKGAVEKILNLCQYELSADGREVPLEASRALQQAETLAGQGLRVLAMARSTEGKHVEGHSLKQAASAGELVFLGLQAMMDPPRPEAIAAVGNCQKAGIAVKMITGDHAMTGRAIAEQIGLIPETPVGTESNLVMTGSAIATTPHNALPRAVDRSVVFARVSPEQKLRLVEALQTEGHIVAMTGDGVNDAPALKQADIGIAMGRVGTEVAKESSDMVLTDDNFASIEAAVEEGRGVFDNLTKFIVWTLPTNMGEGLVIMVAIGAGFALPILPVQILWINMTTAVALGLMLAFEPKETGIMDRPPRDPGQPLLTGALLWRIVLVGALLLAGSFGLFLWEQERGSTVVEARTVAVNVFVVVEMFYLFNCRSLERSLLQLGLFSNPWVTWGVIVMIALQLLFTYAPFMHSLFHSAPIDGGTWLPILGIGVASYFIVGLDKWVRHRFTTKNNEAVVAGS
ncbi:cation-transporting P-type ATPase [Candidatus Nitronereus thalassa]|uniref:Cation-transporting P-type ATPase n=1 Tax=Candidatus Nitronereus thalassa TaxID=3020898 RepID=A0ABU3K8V8_9BACT|nr:cation-transporting P-type ATPase [Candidatus Nitronereus thalassa]MDT7042880.1 cation-transporting P-type ATPase [Candidatus Nitronereus thalassa]